MDFTESGFQTPASKKRKASDSPSLSPASQPSIPPSSYKSTTPLIATSIDPKFNTHIRIMSELRWYHLSLRVFSIKQTRNGWIFTGDAPKDFDILQTEPKMQQMFEENVKLSLARSYPSTDVTKGKVLVFNPI